MENCRYAMHVIEFAPFASPEDGVSPGWVHYGSFVEEERGRTPRLIKNRVQPTTARPSWAHLSGSVRPWLEGTVRPWRKAS